MQHRKNKCFWGIGDMSTTQETMVQDVLAHFTKIFDLWPRPTQAVGHHLTKLIIFIIRPHVNLFVSMLIIEHAHNLICHT